jgi:chromosome segregation ATPase
MGIEQQAPRGDDFRPAPPTEHDKQELERLRQIDRTTLGDLEGELWSIGEQLTYWEGIKDAAQIQIKDAKSRLNAAKHTIADLKASGVGGQQAKYDRKMAQDTLESQATRLEFAEKRLKNAEVQLKSWEKRKSNFDYSKLKKLRREATRREQMTGRTSGPITEFAAESF